jgi:hypothetical protein
MLSEIDLKDWIRSEEPVKLYNVERDSVVSLAGDEIFKFDHIDGMFSVCYTLAGNLFHIAATTPVYVWSKKTDG